MNNLKNDFKINLIDCSDKVIDDLIEFGKLYYESSSSNLKQKYLKWLYLENPAGIAKAVIAKDDDLLVGVIILVPLYLEKSGCRQKCYFAMNVLTHPNYRGRNLFGLMIDSSRIFLSNNGFWLIGHPNQNAVKGWVKQNMRFREPLKIGMLKILPLMLLKKSCVTMVNSEREINIIPQTFWDSVSNSNEFFHVSYSPVFLAWRFIHAVDKIYKIQIIKRDSDVVGILISKKYKFGVSLLIDVIAEPKNMSYVLSHVILPTLIASPHKGNIVSIINESSWTLPVKKEMPFFVSTWQEDDGLDCSFVSLSSGDF